MVMRHQYLVAWESGSIADIDRVFAKRNGGPQLAVQGGKERGDVETTARDKFSAKTNGESVGVDTLSSENAWGTESWF